jgi:hypothetical protein
VKLLTEKQKSWLVRKAIKVNGFYSFPAFGFTVYAEPKYDSGVLIDANPFTKSLSGEFFLVKEKVNGFCRGNFCERPKGKDVYLSEEELSRRGLIEMLFLFIISFIPLTLYNLCRGGVKKQEQ